MMPVHKIVIWGPTAETLLPKEITTDEFFRKKAAFGIGFAEFPHSDREFQILDISSKVISGNRIHEHLKGVSAVILVYDASDNKFIQSIDEYFAKVNEILNEEIPIFIVGNKCDKEEKISIEKNHKRDMLGYHEVSTETGEGIKELFDLVANLVIVEMNAKPTKDAQPQIDKIQAQIKILNEALGSLVCMNADRKRDIVVGLTYLKEQREKFPNVSIQKHIEDALTKHPILAKCINTDVETLLVGLNDGPLPEILNVDNDNKNTNQNCLLM